MSVDEILINSHGGLSIYECFVVPKGVTINLEAILGGVLLTSTNKNSTTFTPSIIFTENLIMPDIVLSFDKSAEFDSVFYSKDGKSSFESIFDNNYEKELFLQSNMRSSYVNLSQLLYRLITKKFEGDLVVNIRSCLAINENNRPYSYMYQNAISDQEIYKRYFFNVLDYLGLYRTIVNIPFEIDTDVYNVNGEILIRYCPDDSKFMLDKTQSYQFMKTFIYDSDRILYARTTYDDLNKLLSHWDRVIEHIKNDINNEFSMVAITTPDVVKYIIPIKSIDDINNTLHEYIEGILQSHYLFGGKLKKEDYKFKLFILVKDGTVNRDNVITEIEMEYKDDEIIEFIYIDTTLTIDDIIEPNSSFHNFIYFNTTFEVHEEFNEILENLETTRLVSKSRTRRYSKQLEEFKKTIPEKFSIENIIPGFRNNKVFKTPKRDVIVIPYMYLLRYIQIQIRKKNLVKKRNTLNGLLENEKRNRRIITINEEIAKINEEIAKIDEKIATSKETFCSDLDTDLVQGIQLPYTYLLDIKPKIG